MPDTSDETRGRFNAAISHLVLVAGLTPSEAYDRAYIIIFGKDS